MEEDTTIMGGIMHLQGHRVEAAEEIIGVGVGDDDAGDFIQTFRRTDTT